MKPMETTTRHAEKRMQQRSVPPFVVDMILKFGEPERSHGANRYVLNKKARKKVESYLGPMKLTEPRKLFDAYVVLSDDSEIITTGYRTKRFKS